MFFFSLAIFLACAWTLPWWGSAIAALIFGWIQPRPWRGGWPVVMAAAVAFMAIAHVEDSANYGLVSKHVAGLLMISMPVLVYVVMAVFGGATVLVCLLAGVSLRALINPKTK